MKACLQLQPEFCSREKQLIFYFSKIYATFKDIPSESNIDSVHEMRPKVWMYNNEIVNYI